MSSSSPQETPSSPKANMGDATENGQATNIQDFAQPSPPQSNGQAPGPRSYAGSQFGIGMTSSSTPLGSINAARRPQPQQSASALLLGKDLQAKMKANMEARRGSGIGNLNPQGGVPGGAIAGPRMNVMTPGGPVGAGGPLVGGPAGRNLMLPPRPGPASLHSAPVVPKANIGGLGARRKLKGPGTLADITGQAPAPADAAKTKESAAFSAVSEFVNTKTGTLNFKNKAVISGDGIEFQNGKIFNISLDEVDTINEMGKGNYGTVYQVRHSRPRMRKPGAGLAGNKSSGLPSLSLDDNPSSPAAKAQGGGTTGIVMAMKEIRLELDESKFAQIIMELDILHRCVSPYIVDFYGAFFQEGAVYICMEFMDGGSVDKLYGDGVPENVLRKITFATVMGLKALKEEHNIIHRDVKPTNILVNSRGQVKICDFGVSGNLVASIAKTNIGCQSYMAPERISSGGMSAAGSGGGTYSVQSDIWSLGLTIIECALGKYPYPPETYDNIFSQLSVSDSGCAFDHIDIYDIYRPSSMVILRTFLRPTLRWRETSCTPA